MQDYKWRMHTDLAQEQRNVTYFKSGAVRTKMNLEKQKP